MPETLGRQPRLHPFPLSPIQDISRTDWSPLLCPSPIPFLSALFLFSPRALSSICQDFTDLYNRDTRDMSAFRKSRIQGISQQQQNLLCFYFHCSFPFCVLNSQSNGDVALGFHHRCLASPEGKRLLIFMRVSATAQD